MRIGENVLDIVNRHRGDAPIFEAAHIFITGECLDFARYDAVQFRVIGYAGDVVFEARIGDQVLAFDPVGEALEHGLGGGRDGDPAAVLCRIAVSGGGVFGKVPCAGVFFSV